MARATDLRMNNGMQKKTTLFRKTTQTFLITGIILAFLSCVALYFYTKYLLQEEIEEELFSTENRVATAIADNLKVYSLPPIAEVSIVTQMQPQTIKDTLLYDPSQDEMELFRELSTYKVINGKIYHIIIRTLVVESGDILLAIVVSNIAIFVLAFIFLFYFNTSHNLKIWSPFFNIIDQMKRFSVTSKEPLQAFDSNIFEFIELQDQIILLTDKVRLDYENLKQFTENVSHEIQTPLAIIQAKIDNIINEHEINDKQFEQITSIQKDIHRLKQLSRRITMLTKIENNQFVNLEEVNFTTLINEKISGYKELEITNLSYSAVKELVVTMDPFLADILLNNLLSNAIKYSGNTSTIQIISTDNVLIIENRGEQPIKHPEKLFTRFYREGSNAQSSGLGLAIVKKICENYGFLNSYRFEKSVDEDYGKHIFEINFSTQITKS